MPDVNYLCFTANAGSDVTISSTTNWTSSDSQAKPVITYSPDRENWYAWNWGSTEYTLRAGQSIYWRGNNDYIATQQSYFKFITTGGTVALSGNLMTLLDSTGVSLSISAVGRGFYCLFNGAAITSAPELPATTLAPECYRQLFYACSQLVSPPSTLPATTVPETAYDSMFSLCSQLTYTPTFPSTLTVGSSGMHDMFFECSSLRAFNALTSTSVGAPTDTSDTSSSEVAYMFYGCSSLQDLGNLCITKLNYEGAKYICGRCQSLVVPPKITCTTATWEMFYCAFDGCTALTTMPDLRSFSSCYIRRGMQGDSLSIRSFAYMFAGCTSLKLADTLAPLSGPITVRQSPLTIANNFHDHEFNGCVSLEHITIPFANWNGSNLGLSGLTTHGTVIVLNASLPLDEGGLPPFWDIRSPAKDVYNLGVWCPDTGGGNLSVQDRAVDGNQYEPSNLSNSVIWGGYFRINTHVYGGVSTGATKIRPPQTPADHVSATVYIHPDEGYSLPSSVYVSNAFLLRYDAITGEILIENAYGDVQITAMCSLITDGCYFGLAQYNNTDYYPSFGSVWVNGYGRPGVPGEIEEQKFSGIVPRGAVGRWVYTNDTSDVSSLTVVTVTGEVTTTRHISVNVGETHYYEFPVISNTGIVFSNSLTLTIQQEIANPGTIYKHITIDSTLGTRHTINNPGGVNWQMSDTKLRVNGCWWDSYGSRNLVSVVDLALSNVYLPNTSPSYMPYVVRVIDANGNVTYARSVDNTTIPTQVLLTPYLTDGCSVVIRYPWEVDYYTIELTRDEAVCPPLADLHWHDDAETAYLANTTDGVLAAQDPTVTLTNVRTLTLFTDGAMMSVFGWNGSEWENIPITISDLTNTTWLFNNSSLTAVDPNEEEWVFDINFKYADNSTVYDTLYYTNQFEENIVAMQYSRGGTNHLLVYDTEQYPGSPGGWVDNDYKTITITGGEDVTNTTLIDWLQANATLQTPFGGNFVAASLTPYLSTHRKFGVHSDY